MRPSMGWGRGEIPAVVGTQQGLLAPALHGTQLGEELPNGTW